MWQHQKKKKWTWVFLFIKQLHFLPSIFSPFWKENFLVSLKRKHSNPTIYFLSFTPIQTHSKKIFFPFSLQNFSSPLFHPKQTQPKSTYLEYVLEFVCTMWLFYFFINFDLIFTWGNDAASEVLTEARLLLIEKRKKKWSCFHVPSCHLYVCIGFCIIGKLTCTP